MPSISEVFGSEDLLKAADLPHGQQVPVTIESVMAKQFDDGGKLEIRFVGKKKGFICNKTNARTIADMCGDDYGYWPGKQIALVRTFTDFQGKQVECVRVVPSTQQFAPPQQQFTPPPQQQFAPPQQSFAAPQQQVAPQGGDGSPDF